MTAIAVEAPILVAQTRVVRVRELGESYLRLVLAGPDLSRWSRDVVDPGTVRDAYIKVFVPPPGGRGIVPDPLAIREWLTLPEQERGWMRTYTVRRADSVELDGEHVPALTVDVVVHPGADEGPGSGWARSVRPGDTVHLAGPGRGHAPWAAWAPGAAGRVVCAGDETAAPALLSIAGELAAEPRGTREVRIVLELPTPADVLALSAEAPETVTLFSRSGERGHALVHHLAGLLGVGQGCVESVLDGRRPAEREWQTATTVSAGDPYVFLAGEAGLVRAMRRLAVDGAGIPKGAVSFMGYWRRGAAES
ncbi:MAG: siderophore-interacting protein [Dietzia sp.]|jgi:NADPH-dependent ferric siderophore reductase|uniref:siderophore-interacting protein n=4 Tax=Dietziaceae TaxID=85029 RepID=UPI0019CA2E9B|nr:MULTISPECIES: siderophore-interacting protein [Dietzia]MBC7295393.1 siderophore-interacting protein [Dietzia sp.]MCT1516751.1 siderophore-interacting protein [Dietzia cercidiphylli]MDO8395439.1 siderophore-interacting protein [Dietzia sp.]